MNRKNRWLILIVAIAVAARLIVALIMGDRVEPLPAIHDQISYSTLAWNVAQGKGFTFDTPWYPFTKASEPTAHWSFLYVLYLAAVYALVGYHPLVARLIQAVAGGLLLCFLVYRIGRRIAGHHVGIVSAAMAALYAYFIYYSAALMTETFHIIAVLWGLDLAMGLGKRAEGVKENSGKVGGAWDGLMHWILLGLALGIATLQRQVTLIFIPFLYVWLAWTHRRSIWEFFKPAILSFATVAVMILPWTIRNYIVYREFLLLNSNAGFALYWANHPLYGLDFTHLSIDPGPIPPLPEGVQGLNEALLDRLLMRETLHFVVKDLGRYLLLSLNRVKFFFMFLPLAESSLISNLSRVLSFGLFLPFMVYGLFLSRKAWRKCLLLYLFVVIYSLIHISSWPGPRYRLPVDAVLIPFASLALVDTAHRLTRCTVQYDRDKEEICLP